MRILSLVVLLAACNSEQGLVGDAATAGRFNPPDPPVTVQVDRITQVTIPSVDVLWVIDNSCSMQEEQTKLKDNFPLFMQYFTGSGMDYHVGVVSTDVDNRNNAGKLVEDNGNTGPFIDTSYSDREAVSSFQQRATLGTNGSSTECGKDAAFEAINNTGKNPNFYREDASLSIVFISDEHDQSDVTVTEFNNWMSDLKAGTDNFAIASSIVGLSGNDCMEAERGTGYLEVSSFTGGISWSICDADWSGLLEELGLQAAGLKREFFLSLAPVEDTIEVDVQGDDDFRPEKDTWVYNPSRNSITFDAYIPPPLTIVTLTYTPLALQAVTAPEDTAATE